MRKEPRWSRLNSTVHKHERRKDSSMLAKVKAKAVATLCTANILLVKKATFPYLLFPILFQCIKGSENNVKLILE